MELLLKSNACVFFVFCRQVSIQLLMLGIPVLERHCPCSRQQMILRASCMRLVGHIIAINVGTCWQFGVMIFIFFWTIYYMWALLHLGEISVGSLINVFGIEIVANHCEQGWRVWKQRWVSISRLGDSNNHWEPYLKNRDCMGLSRHVHISWTFMNIATKLKDALDVWSRPST